MAASNSKAKLSMGLVSTFADADLVQKNFIRTSRGVIGRLAAPLVAQMGISSKPVTFLDNACGAGALVQEVRKALTPDALKQSTFTCTDISEQMVQAIKIRVASEGWENVESQVANAQDTGLPAGKFSHVGIALGLHIMPQPDDAVRDAIRVLHPGGYFGATTFTKHNGSIWFNPLIKSSFDSFPWDAPVPFPMPMQLHSSGDWTDPAWVEEHLKELGLEDVKVTTQTITYPVANAAEFLDIFGMMLPMLINSFWDPEVVKAHPLEEVKERMTKHLDEMHGNKGWDITGEFICMSGRSKE